MRSCECPGCGAEVTFRGNEWTARCEYCDTQVTRAGARMDPQTGRTVSQTKTVPMRSTLPERPKGSLLDRLDPRRAQQVKAGQEERRNREMGKIRFLGDAGAFKLRTAREAEAELRKMGFTNVRCESMQDMCENILNLDEKVASVTVDGGTFVNYGWYYANATIVIRYHGF